MVVLIYPKDFQPVQRLPFCYLCGRGFAQDAATNRDHVPPKALFAKADRMPLILRTHVTCNNDEKVVDERMGQLIGLRRGVMPTKPVNRKLTFRHLGGNKVAVTNVNVYAAVWRWIRGFHAALYRQPLPLECRRAIELPFQRARELATGAIEVVPLREGQHRRFVELLKLNRAKMNLDRIVNNAGMMTYECVWTQNGQREWACVFGLNVYAWKDLGDKGLGQRGCAGVYTLPSGLTPPTASTAATSPILIPNLDPLDPFGR